MSALRVHCIQHVPFEGLGSIQDWIERRGHSLTWSRMYEGDHIPEPEHFDFLIVMGGPMGVYDTDVYPYLSDEKKAIKAAIDANKKVLGICLGAQLIADTLGAKVFPNKEKEIGWFDITITDEAFYDDALCQAFIHQVVKCFHWHGDTFEIPLGAKHLASSEACPNQMFLYKNHVLGMQFHLEVQEDSVLNMIEFGRDELIESTFVQEEEEIKQGVIISQVTNILMDVLLQQFISLK